MRVLRSTVAMVMGGALLLFLGVWLFGRYTDSRAVSAAEWKAESEAWQDSAKAYRDAVRRDSIVYVDRVRPEYIRVREHVIRDPLTPDATGKVIRACDLVVSACDSIQGGLRGQIRSLEAQNELLRHKPKPARVVAAGDVLYDVVGLRPVFRVGTNVRLFGPINARVEGEYAVPSALREREGGFRVLVGARINFNR